MTSDAVQLRMRPVSDYSRFERFAIPNRPLTRGEVAVYQKLGRDWAQLDATAQTLLYAALLQRKFAPVLRELFLQDAEAGAARVEAIADPQVREVAGKVSLAISAQLGASLAGFQATVARKMDSILGEPYPEPPPLSPPPPNFWQRLLGA